MLLIILLPTFGIPNLKESFMYVALGLKSFNDIDIFFGIKIIKIIVEIISLIIFDKTSIAIIYLVFKNNIFGNINIINSNLIIFSIIIDNT